MGTAAGRTNKQRLSQVSMVGPMNLMGSRSRSMSHQGQLNMVASAPQEDRKESGLGSMDSSQGRGGIH